METPKAGEEVLTKNLPLTADKWLEQLHPEIYKGVLKAMQEYAEQARREERERHAELISGIKEWLPAEHPCSAFRYELEKGLAGAGYGKQEIDSRTMQYFRSREQRGLK